MNEQLLLVLKGILSGGLIVLVNIVAKREPGIAGLIVAFPAIMLLSAFWLVVDGVADTTMHAFFSGMLWGLLPTFAFVLGIVLAQRNSVGLGGAIAVGATAWLLLTTIIQRSGLAH